ncbi:MAG: hypothetical protein KDC66_01070 [Phaeodactylibacter sp.]|nr:hypothetical protein [Phaeodactylibacter sp.]MCB9275009.1 hypothetical protein [Lewinellaceae bacterium]
MRLLTIIFLTLSILITGQVQAQKLSKQEKKELKAKLKNYKQNPNQLLSLEDDLDHYRQENQQLQAQMAQVQAEANRKDSKVASLQQEVDQLNMSLRTAQESIRQLNNDQATASKGPDMSGLVFRVQIGAYGKTNVPANLDKDNDNMDLEVVDGLQKIIIGMFRDMNEADQLRAHMQKIGIKDAWVVPYRDGVRITMEEAKQLMGSGM